MTYKQAYDKIIEAYFKDEIQPMDCKFCFCGTLSIDDKWHDRIAHSFKKYHYTVAEYQRMELALLEYVSTKNAVALKYGPKTDETYEKDLFSGMSAALDVLKQIHIERGEIIDEVPQFVKRELV